MYFEKQLNLRCKTKVFQIVEYENSLFLLFTLNSLSTVLLFKFLQKKTYLLYFTMFYITLFFSRFSVSPKESKGEYDKVNGNN